MLCLGLILAEDGRKMSKHLGNVLEPIPLMDQHGADALRWYMACGGSPWAARRVGHGALEEIVRKVLLTYWNTASFFTLYANAESWSPSRLAEAPAVRRAPAASTAGHWPSCTARCAEVTASTGRVRHRPGRAAAGRVPRRPVQLVRPPLPPPVLVR